MLLLTECVWEYQNVTLWDTHQHALFSEFGVIVPYNSSCFLFNQEKTTQNTSFFIQNNDCRL